MKKDSAKTKKTVLKKCRWLVIPIALLTLAFILISHRPGRYNPVKVVDNNQGLNDAIARSPQPIRLHNITLSDAQVIFTPDQIILMATARAQPVDFVITAELNPIIDQHGLLNIHVNRVALGAIKITGLAKWIAASAYSNWLSSTGTDPNNLAARVCQSLLNDEPFEPVFEVSGKRLQVEQMQLAREMVKLRLIPVSDQSHQP